jgi:hypothetical protein
MKPGRTPQQGAAALAVVMILLLAMTILAAFENRSLLFEQRSSANQYRSTIAAETAEAGLEWAQALLNDGRRLDAYCLPAADQPTSFRERYVPKSAPDAAIAPVTTVRPGCSLGATGLSCHCPDAGGSAEWNGNGPSFTVEFAAVSGDPQALRITARGCSSRGSQCVPDTGSAIADAAAAAQAIFKLRPALRTIPVAALTTGGSTALDGWQLANTDHATHGLLIDAGGTLTLSGTPPLLSTLPGSPIENALIEGDEALARLAAADASGSAFFAALFGGTPAQFAAAPATRRIAGCTAVSCGAALRTAYAEGDTSFFVDGDLQLDAAGWPGATVGSADRPLLLVVGGALRFNGSFPAHGLIYAADSSFDPGGAIDLHGALVARGGLSGSSNGRVSYSPAVLQRLRSAAGPWVRVPGSWRDGRCAATDPAQPCDFLP